MTEKDDPSRVAFGGDGHGGPDLPRRSHTGNGANGNGTLAGQELAFPDSTSDRARSSKLGQLILDTLDRGVIALDLDGVVIDANVDAQRILEAGDSMRVRAGCLEFHDPHLDGRLRQLLSALALGAVVATGFVAQLPAPDNSRPRRMLVSPVSSPASRADIAVLVNIFDTHSKHVISHQLLRDLYGLTAAQAAVTAYLFEGQSVEQTAQKLGVSVNTVRSHLKCTFTKCDVHSQAELLHLLDLGPHSL